ncbi:MAG: TolC family protein [Candidatus Binatia bacterium]|nr:TolC family protein [Candidatus Binatia bacterium]
MRRTAWTLFGLVFGLSMAGSLSAAEPVDLRDVSPPTLHALEVLEQIPGVGEVLRDQWSAELPGDARAAETDLSHYGLLLEAKMQPATLSQCIALALENNTGLRVQRLNPIAAAAEVRRARAAFDPRFFATLTRDRATQPATTFLFAGGSPVLFNQNFTLNAGIRKTLLTGGQISVQFSNNRRLTNPSLANPLVPLYTTSLSVNLVQPLLQNFGWRYSLLLVDIATATQQAAYHQYVASITNLVAQVERAYWGLVLAKENVRVQEQGLELAREILRQNEGKFRVGALPQTAVLEAQANVASREAALIRARNAVVVARDQLRALINAKTEEATALLNLDPEDRPTVEPYATDLKASLERALEQRPELAAARTDVRAKSLQRKVAENQLLPQLNLVAGIGVNGLSGREQRVLFGDPPQPVRVNPSYVGGYGDALALLPDGRFYNYAIGATIEVPLANAQSKAAYAQSNIQFQQSHLNLQQLQEAVTLEVKTAIANLESDLKAIEATRVARLAAEENVRNQKARYDVGLATTKDLLDYTEQLTRAQFAEAEALVRYNTDLAELRRVEGTLLQARNVIVEPPAEEKPSWWARF